MHNCVISLKFYVIYVQWCRKGAPRDGNKKTAENRPESNLVMCFVCLGLKRLRLEGKAMGGSATGPRRDFIFSSTDEPHVARRSEILKKHPEIRSATQKQRVRFDAVEVSWVRSGGRNTSWPQRLEAQKHVMS